MALFTGLLNGNTQLENNDDIEGQSKWSAILSQVQASSPNKLPSGKNLLVLGDDEAGKTSLIARLQGNDDPKKGSGLEYHCLYVRDEYRDDHTRLNVWVMDGDPWHRNLLRFVLNSETFSDTTVMLTAPMTHPWSLLESLTNWASLLEEHIDRLGIPPDILQSHHQKVVKRFQEYIEPGGSGDLAGGDIESLTSPMKRSYPSALPGGPDDFPGGLLPLGENTLTHNLGLELIVVITKTDYMSTLEKDFDYKDEHFDFIQQAIRKFCLKYGAALFYVSVKEDKNCNLLHNYLVHRIYNFPFKTPALVVEKDSVFIPSGWDNEKKIFILYDNLTTVKPDDNYTDVIIKPLTRKPLQREAEVTADDDQIFLTKQLGLLMQQLPPPGSRPQDSPIRTPAGVQKSADRRLTGSPGVQASPKKIDGVKGAAGSEGVLQNFFNSLLYRKTGAQMGVAGSPGGVSIRPSVDNATVRNSAAAELDRMTRSKKPLSPSQPTTLESHSSGATDNGGSPS